MALASRVYLHNSPFTTEIPIEHSIALVTGTTSGLGYAAASLLAAKGYRQAIVTGRSLVPLVSLIPGMNQTPEIAARRYLQASEFGTDVSGQFSASAQGKFTGPVEEMRHPHFHDRASQEAA